MAELVLQATEMATSQRGSPVIPVEETPSKKTSITSGRVSKASTRRPRQVSSVTHKSAESTSKYKPYRGLRKRRDLYLVPQQNHPTR